MLADRLILSLSLIATTALPFGIASYAAEPVVVTESAEVAVVVIPGPTRDRWPAVDVTAYLMSATNPRSGGLSRELVLAKSEISKHDPIHNLSFACCDAATYAKSLLLIDKMVHVLGIEVERGGQKWFVVCRIDPVN